MNQWNFLAAATIIGLASCGGGGGGNPKPVTVLSPAARPDLQMNAFLISENQTLGCDQYQLLQTSSEVGQKGQVSITSNSSGSNNAVQHEEPPIGGEDGSFRLHMNAMALLGSTASIKKACIKPDHVDIHSTGWQLHWKVWDQSGAVTSQSSAPGKDVPVNVPVVIRFSGTTSTVTLTRKTDSSGSAWVAQASSSFANPVTSSKLNQVHEAHDLIDANATGVRMSQIDIGSDVIPLTVTGSASTCSGFVICHGTAACQVPKPDKCASTGGTGGSAGNVH